MPPKRTKASTSRDKNNTKKFKERREVSIISKAISGNELIYEVVFDDSECSEWVSKKNIKNKSLIKSFEEKEKTDKEANGQINDSTEEVLYVVERIIDYRDINGVREYLCRWEGYDERDDTWQTADTFTNPKFVEEFEKSITPRK
uniref:Chromo domain-containing protein n=1 Tax=Parastrongyloides trichosuri TaxID=131310 RepID=A0A0N4ZWL6_PARTI